MEKVILAFEREKSADRIREILRPPAWATV